ncbi:glycoside hydrolase family 15 protein [Iamia sp.]|uniref:glycoside hydrolase family 15 protein n=1 Tax=Iamia sp. TaxID=2722710 RepID=UPI002CED332D|nr:glycoside hydrolase family 15 protein [Iamia sp.]HXH59571.1 glycoside hydrolase family 15 protein [Iamia sp.]
MAGRIEDYALLSDTESAALVGRDGSIDWLTFPRFDSPACFAALLGTPAHGRWLIAPAVPVVRVERRYRPGTLVLETTFHTAEGTVRLIDCMPVRDRTLQVARLVEGVSGRVPMRMELVVRPDYGSIVPWVRRHDGQVRFVAGPDALLLSSPVPVQPDGWRHVAAFTLATNESAGFELAWHPSAEPTPELFDVARNVERTTKWWEEWSSRSRHCGEWTDVVTSSLTVLKGLTYAPTGGIVAAATTSLPEHIGGERNWDYRYCWLRDATYTLMALLEAGFTAEAAAWREWLLRAVAGRPDQVQIMYGCAGERRLPEWDVPWLPGYEGSQPVRVGNAAHDQLQLDVFGEVLDALHQAAVAGVGDVDGVTWPLATALVEHLAEIWRQPDEGIWEVRGGARHFTHSKVMAWVALDRALRWSELAHLDAPTARWAALRDEIHAEVLAHGVDDRGVLVQSYGGTALDASLLLVPLVGFLPPRDPRVAATVQAIQRELTEDGFVLRYRPEHTDDGLAGSEGVFLLCSFWLVDALVVMGRAAEGRALYERLVALRNDVGLLAEEWDPVAGRLLGNFPQAFSHIGLVESAMLLTARGGARHPGARPNP